MMAEFEGLTEAELLDVASALRSGRLAMPISALSLQRYCLASAAAAAAGRIQQLVQEGLKPEHLALMLEILASGRRQSTALKDRVELVWTGPEAPGTLNRDTSVVVRELFSTAQEHVLVAGYAVYQGCQVFRALAGRMDQKPALKVQMFLNAERRRSDTSKDSEILLRFAHEFKAKQWPGKRLPEVYYDPRALAPEAGKRASLHAKCIVVDHKVAFVSSANFTEAAQIRNIEVGALIRSEVFAGRLAQQFEGLAAAGMVLRVAGI